MRATVDYQKRQRFQRQKHNNVKLINKAPYILKCKDESVQTNEIDLIYKIQLNKISELGPNE